MCFLLSICIFIYINKWCFIYYLEEITVCNTGIMLRKFGVNCVKPFGAVIQNTHYKMYSISDFQLVRDNDCKLESCLTC